MNDAEVLKRYLAEEMVEEYEAGRTSRRRMIRTVGQILGVATVGPALLTSLRSATPPPSPPPCRAPARTRRSR